MRISDWSSDVCSSDLSATFWQQIDDLFTCTEPKRRVGRLPRRISQIERGITMRKLAVAVALASTTLASPVLARDNYWYVGVGAVAMLVEALDLSLVKIGHRSVRQ